MFHLKNTELPNTAVMLAGNVDISDHRGIPKPFSSDCLVTENQTAKQMLQFAELSLRNKGPSFQNLTFLLMPLHYRI